MFGADGDFGENFGHGLLRFLVYVAADGGPEGVEDIHDAEDEEYVQRELRVEGEHVRQMWVRF